MRFKRTIISLFLIIGLLFTLTITVNASDENPAYENQEFTSYADLCHDYYAYPHLYTIYDKNNVDVSDAFYSATIEWYKNNDINSIYDYAFKNVSYMDKTELISNSNARGALQTVRKTQTFYDEVYNTKMNDFEIAYTLSGRFTYNANTGLISSYSSPSVTLTHVSLTGNISAAMTDISTNATLTTNGYKVKFSCQFNILSTVIYPVGIVDITMAEETTGPYINSFVAYGS